MLLYLAQNRPCTCHILLAQVNFPAVTHEPSRIPGEQWPQLHLPRLGQVQDPSPISTENQASWVRNWIANTPDSRGLSPRLPLWFSASSLCLVLGNFPYFLAKSTKHLRSDLFSLVQNFWMFCCRRVFRLEMEVPSAIYLVHGSIYEILPVPPVMEHTHRMV